MRRMKSSGRKCLECCKRGPRARTGVRHSGVRAHASERGVSWDREGCRSARVGGLRRGINGTRSHHDSTHTHTHAYHITSSFMQGLRLRFHQTANALPRGRTLAARERRSCRRGRGPRAFLKFQAFLTRTLVRNSASGFAISGPSGVGGILTALGTRRVFDQAMGRRHVR